MYRYLPHKTADFTAEILSVRPTTILPHTGDKKQIIHEFDDGSVSAVGISTSNFFTVQLQWSYISPADYRILMDFWFSGSKAAGRTRTFYWEHPVTGMVYVARFMGPLTPAYNNVGHLSVSQIALRIEGVYSVLVNMPLYDSVEMIAGVGTAVFSRPGEATHINSHGDIVNLAANEPGFDEDGIGLPCASTNILTQSNDITAWYKANGATTPDAYTFIPAAGTASYVGRNLTAPVGLNTCYIIAEKLSGSNIDQLLLLFHNTLFNEDLYPSVAFNFDTGTISVQGNDYNNIIDFGYVPLVDKRYLIYATVDIDNSVLVAPQVRYGLTDANGTTDGFRIHHAQWENLPFWTPPIYTTDEPKARLASTLEFPYVGNFPGSLADKMVVMNVNVMGTSVTNAMSFNSGDLRIFAGYQVNDRKTFASMVSGSQTPLVVTPKGSNRIGVSYDSQENKLSMCINGSLAGVQDGVTTSFSPEANIMLSPYDKAYLKIKGLVILNRCPDEKEMETL